MFYNGEEERRKKGRGDVKLKAKGKDRVKPKVKIQPPKDPVGWTLTGHMTAPLSS